MYIQREGRNPIRLPRVFAERMIAKGIFRPVNPQEEESEEEIFARLEAEKAEAEKKAKAAEEKRIAKEKKAAEKKAKKEQNKKAK